MGGCSSFLSFELLLNEEMMRDGWIFGFFQEKKKTSIEDRGSDA